LQSKWHLGGSLLPLTPQSLRARLEQTKLAADVDDLTPVFVKLPSPSAIAGTSILANSTHLQFHKRFAINAGRQFARQ
jgi:hypothetical protein